MFQINLSVYSINYGSVLHTVFPAVFEKVNRMDSQNLLIRLVKELGGDSEKVLQALLNYLPEETKNELICQCLNSYGSTLTRKLNEYLQTDTWGKNFTIGGCYASCQNEKLTLVAENVHANYRALLTEAGNVQSVEQVAKRIAGNGFLGKLAAKAATTIAEQAAQKYSTMSEVELENAGIGLLNQPLVQDKILKLISNALQAKSLDIIVDRVSVEKADSAIRLDDGKIIDSIQLSPALENNLMKALADFLRDKL